MSHLLNSFRPSLARRIGSALTGSSSSISSSSSSSLKALGPSFSVLSQNNSSQKRYYHESVIDHFEFPRNVGKLDSKKKNVGSAFVGKASCGDVIKLQIEVDEETGNVVDAKFKTFGCGSAIAASSLATEKLIGKPLSEAESIRNEDISKELRLPPVKIHCSVLAEEAIQEAIADYKKKKAEN